VVVEGVRGLFGERGAGILIVCCRNLRVDLSASNSTSFDGKKDMFPTLNIVVRPKSVHLSEDGGLTLVPNHDSC
jgi:hypothetical protein